MSSFSSHSGLRHPGTRRPHRRAGTRKNPQADEQACRWDKANELELKSRCRKGAECCDQQKRPPDIGGPKRQDPYDEPENCEINREGQPKCRHHLAQEPRHILRHAHDGVVSRAVKRRRAQKAKSGKAGQQPGPLIASHLPIPVTASSPLSDTGANGYVRQNDHTPENVQAATAAGKSRLRHGGGEESATAQGDAIAASCGCWPALETQRAKAPKRRKVPATLEGDTSPFWSSAPRPPNHGMIGHHTGVQDA